ncbi:MAG: MATE family efflux transporter [Lachnospiraceae bacterium]|nr:MATE family efflux transporter [Lachnospiraceae bacterium]
MTNVNKKDLLARMRAGENLSRTEQIWMVIQLAVPAILAQVSSVIMQYIDASMVGHLGAESSAAIGIVSSSTWLLDGVSASIGVGFYVQVAHRIGAGKDAEARSLVRHGLLTVLAVSAAFSMIAVLIHRQLPVWLGGAPEICGKASQYFLIFGLGMPAFNLEYTAGGMLQSSGNMKVPSILNIFMCALDVFYNMLFIFPTRTVLVFGRQLTVFGFGMDVAGAALGTAAAEFTCMILMLWFLLVRSEKLHLRREKTESSYCEEFAKAVRIAWPIGAENVLTGGAQVVSTRIVAPLGTIAIAANSFAVTAEALCYMPGYGISSAATTITGQTIGARRQDLTRRLAFLATAFGMLVMGGTGVLMYILTPQIIGVITPVEEVRALAVSVLRIEAFAEPMFAASIVVSGVFRGSGDTLTSTVVNLICMWGIRLPLAAVLSRRIGLAGVWSAMCFELIICGAIFLFLLNRKTKRMTEKV